MSIASDGKHLDGFLGFGAYSRRVVDTLRSLNEPNPYFRGLVVDLGFSFVTTPYDQPSRKSGRSHHSLVDLVDYALLGLSANISKLLRGVTIIGLGLGFLGCLSGIFYLAAKLIWWDAVPFGLAPLLVGSLLFGGVQLSILGLLGLAVSGLREQASGKPLVIESRRVNF
jgi:hypothetical protein